MPPARQPSQPFSKDERVLCFHHEMLYEAKVLEIQPADSGDGFQYKVHYKGWKNTWDDWVPPDRIRKFTDENKELAAQLAATVRNAQSKSASKVPKKGAKGPNGTDSARGSEERGAGVAAAGGRGGPRRTRDFDMEQVSLTFFLSIPAALWVLRRFHSSRVFCLVFRRKVGRFRKGVPGYQAGHRRMEVDEPGLASSQHRARIVSIEYARGVRERYSGADDRQHAARNDYAMAPSTFNGVPTSPTSTGPAFRRNVVNDVAAATLFRLNKVVRWPSQQIRSPRGPGF